jgi:hypothetical protein
MSEENFLRYRLQVVQRMAEGPLKRAIVTAIATRAENLRATHGAACGQAQGSGTPFNQVDSRLAR